MEKKLWELDKKSTSFFEQILEVASNMVTYLSSFKPFKYDEQDMVDNAGEGKTNL